MAYRPLTLGIYYTNTSPVSTIIWLNIATKLCQPRKPVLGPSGGQKDTHCLISREDAKVTEGAGSSLRLCVNFVPLRETKPTDGGRRRLFRSGPPARMDPNGQTGKKSRLPAPLPEI